MLAGCVEKGYDETRKGGTERKPMAGWCVNVVCFYFAFRVRGRVRRRWSYALPSISNRAGWKRGLNKYSTTLAERARRFFPSLREN